MIIDCISIVSFSIHINIQARGFIKPQRGLRQGDLLLPYLFLSCAESLSCMLSVALQSGNIYGARVASGSPKIFYYYYYYFERL